MQLSVKDTILISSVRPNALRRGDTVDVADAQGRDLIARLPAYFEELPAPVAAEARKPGRKAKA